MTARRTLVDRLLQRALPPGVVGDSIRGDLLEELSAAGGGLAAHVRYATRAISVALRYLGRHRGVGGAHHDRPIQRGMMDATLQDLKFAVRTLLKRPAFPTLVIATLALGIGAATAIFSIVEAILLRPLPYAEPHRLVVFNETTPGGRMTLGWPNYLDFRDRATSFEATAAYQGTAFTVLDGERPQRVSGRFVSASFLDVLGTPPLVGRTFMPADDRPGAAPVAIISDRFWKGHLDGDPNVLGRTLRTSERTLTIVGVSPPGFGFARTDDILVPIGITAVPASGLLDRGNHFNLFAIARLKAGVTVKQAQLELERIAADLGREYPNTNSGNGAEAQRLRDRAVENVEPMLIALMGAVGWLLILACVNVANLLVARGAARQHELAIRTALGGSRWRLVRHLLAESSLLSLAGAVAGTGIAIGLVKTLVAMAPAHIPHLDQVGINQTSLLFALAASVVCGLLFGAVPALQMSGTRGQNLLARATRTSDAVSPRRTRRILMGAEVALALVLLAGCGLMVRTMMRLASVDPGFRSDHLLTARVALSGDAWNAPERRVAFYDQVLERVRRLPGVTGAALTLSLPIEGSNWGSIFIVSDKPVPPRAELPYSAFVPVSALYFETMGIALKRGRTFDARDTPTGARVAVVNETLAARIWPGEDPVGKRLKQGWPENAGPDHPWREVIGVVADVKLSGVDRDAAMQTFLPVTQDPSRNLAIVARTDVDPETLAKPLESAVHAVDPTLPVIRILPMTQLMSSALAMRRLSTMILSVFGGIAVLIAAVGLYGIASHNVTERTREIGVRMALGAERRSVLRLFIGQGLVTATAGAFVGFAGALGMSRWLETMLFGVTPTDPITLGTVTVTLLAVAAFASYIPARRATRIDPLVALKAE